MQARLSALSTGRPKSGADRRRARYHPAHGSPSFESCAGLLPSAPERRERCGSEGALQEMNASALNPVQVARLQEAADWFLRLKEAPNDATITAWMEWCEADARN